MEIRVHSGNSIYESMNPAIVIYNKIVVVTPVNEYMI